MKNLYKHREDSLGSFTYAPWNNGTIQYIGLFAMFHWYFIDDGVPLPESDIDEFIPVEKTAEVLIPLRKLHPSNNSNPFFALGELQTIQSEKIDIAAGKARLRYITDVPGQQGVYITKAIHAQTYVDSNYTGPVPAYVQCEADLQGITPIEAADQILMIKNQWENVIGPQIELLRRSGKISISTATVDQLDTITSTIIDALNLI